MDDAVGVEVGHPSRDVECDAAQLREGEAHPVALAEQVVQRPALHEPGDDAQPLPHIHTHAVELQQLLAAASRHEGEDLHRKQREEHNSAEMEEMSNTETRAVDRDTQRKLDSHCTAGRYSSRHWFVQMPVHVVPEPSPLF